MRVNAQKLAFNLKSPLVGGFLLAKKYGLTAFEILVAGVGFEPTTFWLWARRATGLLYPATIGIIVRLTKQKVKPLAEVTAVLGLFGIFLNVFGFGGFGIFWKNNYGFAFEFFAKFGARHQFLVFFSFVILLFEFESFNFELELGGFELARFELFFERPVARHGRNSAPSPGKTQNQSDHKDDIIERQNVALGEVAHASEKSFDFLPHVIIIALMLTCFVCPLPCYYAILFPMGA